MATKQQDATRKETLQSSHNKAGPKKKGEKVEMQNKFIELYSKHGNITTCCDQVGVSRRTHYDWMEHDEEYSFRFNQAGAEFADRIEEEIRRRAMDGVEEYVVGYGKIVNIEKEDENGEKKLVPLTHQIYSDRLLEILAKSHIDKYRDRMQLQHSGEVAHRSTLEDDLCWLTEEQLAIFNGWVQDAKARV